MAVVDSNPEREDEVYFSALGISDLEERQRFVERECAGDLGLRKTVEEMLASEKEADDLITRASSSVAGAVRELNDPAVARGPRTADELVHTYVDRYKIESRLGEGGCGAVYLAEQESPVRRRVALKVIKLGMDTKSVIARFEVERQALAIMDHPNIARVLDAGATSTGRPYFVMELVSGTKITNYCDEQKLSVVERLKIFIQVCYAIQHAHQKGIVHRDLKPSNILVSVRDGMPVPKIIDFGVAKAIEANLISPNVTTSNGQLIGTPAYMSPEQAALSGEDVDTRSDIYSLGVLLYELLSGRTPFDSKALLSSGLDELRRTLREVEPKRPSTTLCCLKRPALQEVAHTRNSAAGALISEVGGDLDWIVMKALEKDPARRYESVTGFRRDIERYLSHELVVARPPTTLYRLGKWMRRNWILFIAGMAVTLALAIGLGTSVWMLRQERLLRERAVAAEQEQAHLRESAERGQATEAELRRQSESRGSMMQAAALIREQALAKSDELISKVPLENPTLEGVEVFRRLGDWNAVNGKWTAARDRFYQLRHANRLEDSESTTLDISRAAVAYVEANDAPGYERFREYTIADYAGTTNAIVAERIVRNCLLLPCSASFLQSLAPFDETALSGLEKRDFSAPSPDWWPGWGCLSQGVMEYRLGNLDDAVIWSRRCLRQGETPLPRASAARAILSMALFRSGKLEEARAEFAQANASVTERFSREVTDLATNGYWFDWVSARIFLREAQTILASPREAQKDN